MSEEVCYRLPLQIRNGELQVNLTLTEVNDKLRSDIGELLKDGLMELCLGRRSGVEGVTYLTTTQPDIAYAIGMKACHAESEETIPGSN